MSLTLKLNMTMKKNEIEIPDGKRAEWVNGVLTLVDDTPKDVTERIKTFGDACRELGEDHPFVLAYQNTNLRDPEVAEENRDILAYMKLRIIVAALNEGWTPELKEGEILYYPWHSLYTQSEIDDMDEDERKERRMMQTGDYATEFAGFAFADSNNAPSFMAAYFGSRLCLKSSELASYCGKQFIEIWADSRLIKK